MCTPKGMRCAALTVALPVSDSVRLGFVSVSFIR
jgi:hypothetical protein